MQSKYKISVLIPSRKEEFLAKTVEDILENTDNTTEIIVVLDGELANPGLPDNERLTVIYLPESIGQRASTNLACKLSQAKYIIKCDAHVSFDKGLDRKMLEAFERAGDNTLMAPIMKNLHCFNLVCPDGHSRYQSPDGPCQHKIGEKNGKDILCGKETKKDIVWISKKSPQSVSYCFDSEPHFQYFKEYAKRPEYKKDLEETGLTKTMSLQGSFFMCTRKKFWELNICDDEGFGSWGSMGIEISMKFWLSDGQVLVNHNTWNSHMFRTQGSTFGFPYPQSGRQVQNAKKYARDLFFNNKWPLQIHPLSWVLDKFKPINGWTDKEIEDQKKREKDHPNFGINAIKKSTSESKSLAKEVEISKGIIFYTDNKLKLSIAHAVQDQLRSIELPIVSASLKPMPHFGKNVYLPLKRGQLTMFKQILAALEASTADVIFHCENDCLYPKEHFNFTPPRKDTFYYNLNVIKIDANDGKTLKVDVCRQVSGLCAYRELLVSEYRRRVEIVERDGYKGNSGYEPGTKCIKSGGYSDTGREDWNSEVPILDIRHDNNLTKNRFKKEQFRNQSNTVGWTEGNYEDIKGWDVEIIRKIIKN
jgi:hypothetical protein